MNLAPVEFMEFSLPAEPVAPEKTAYKVAMPVTPEQLPMQAKRVAAIAKPIAVRKISDVIVEQ